MFSFLSGLRFGDVLVSALYNIGWKPPPSPLPLPEGGMTKSLPISGSNSYGNLNGRPYEQHVSKPQLLDLLCQEHPSSVLVVLPWKRIVRDS